MDATTILVKNMVCHRCVMAVESILEKGAIPFHKVSFGEIHLNNALSAEQKSYLKASLGEVGFEMIDNHSSGIVEKIKQFVIKKARNEVPAAEQKIKLSQYLTDKVHHEYTYQSSLFSSVEGRTIENYFIEQRIEKAKELLIYDQLTLSEIAFELEYSSAAHLSSQFKKTTGLTPTYFKQIGSLKRKALDKI
ncbi:MAG: AraC family transcriptional regulator [Flavobacterium sp.]